MLPRTQTAIAVVTMLAASPVAAATEGASNTAGQRAADSLCKTGFMSSDDNGDGRISREEMSSSRDRMFDALDANGDGELARDEYLDCMNQSARSAVGGTDRNSGTRDTDISAADSDNSGSLDTREYMSATHDAQQQARAGDEAGLLLLRRYVAVPTGFSDSDLSEMSDEETAARAARGFRMFDKDASGDISSEEWSNASSMKNDISAVLNMEYDSIDTDASGSVTRQEFSNAGSRGWDSAREAVRNATGAQGASETGTRTSEDSRTSEAANTEAGDRGSAGNSTPPVVYFRYFAPLDAG